MVVLKVKFEVPKSYINNTNSIKTRRFSYFEIYSFMWQRTLGSLLYPYESINLGTFWIRASLIR